MVYFDSLKCESRRRLRNVVLQLITGSFALSHASYRDVSQSLTDPEAFNVQLDSPCSRGLCQHTSYMDPGEYLIYIYSEFMICRAWKDMDYPWFKASVEGTPVRLIVQPALMPFFEEGFVICSENDTTHGRYLATTYVQLAHSLESVRMGSL